MHRFWFLAAILFATSVFAGTAQFDEGMPLEKAVSDNTRAWYVSPPHGDNVPTRQLSCLEILGLKLHKIGDYRHHLQNPAFLPYVALNVINRFYRFANRQVYVPLRDLKLMHPVNYPIFYTQKRFRDRIENLRRYRDLILDVGYFSIAQQQIIISSDNPMYAHEDADGRFATFNGNGRLEAIRAVFEQHPELLIELNVSDVPPAITRPLVGIIRSRQNLSD